LPMSRRDARCNVNPAQDWPGAAAGGGEIDQYDRPDYHLASVTIDRAAANNAASAIARPPTGGGEQGEADGSDVITTAPYDPVGAKRPPTLGTTILRQTCSLHQGGLYARWRYFARRRCPSSRGQWVVE
jgi:hypothetical protein